MKRFIAIAACVGTLTTTLHAQDIKAHIAKTNPSLDNATVVQIASELQQYPPIMTRIVERESTFNPIARNKNCIGLAGINKNVWLKNLIAERVVEDIRDLWSIKGNIKAGWYIISQYKMCYCKYRGLHHERRRRHL